jgi:hypothetical protein
VSKSRTLIGSAIVVAASLAIVGGRAAAATGTTACAAVAPNTATAIFASLGDSALYIQASSGTPVLADGTSLSTTCTRTAGIQAVVRFYARSVDGTGAIHVEVITNRGKTVLDGGLVTATSTLDPVSTVAIPWDKSGKGASDVQVRLTAVGGSFEIGAVYIDPYVQR